MGILFKVNEVGDSVCMHVCDTSFSGPVQQAYTLLCFFLSARPRYCRFFLFSFSLSGPLPARCFYSIPATPVLHNRGLNNSGQLGQGEELDRRGDSPETLGANLPAVVLGTGDVPTAIDCGSFHTCILLGDNSVKW